VVAVIPLSPSWQAKTCPPQLLADSHPLSLFISLDSQKLILLLTYLSVSSNHNNCLLSGDSCCQLLPHVRVMSCSCFHFASPWHYCHQLTLLLQLPPVNCCLPFVVCHSYKVCCCYPCHHCSVLQTTLETPNDCTFHGLPQHSSSAILLVVCRHQ